ncbi:acetolactate synthase large subunit [Mycobacterium koreense]|uniref:acetolactate synthase n=1 Tax=Mycolicibacillus koreensis TaxID=1069220 RepID=A0A7I7SA16_9MYCO|nr:acetolactate synthase large subunit [Mycolicibacillus koreensis]MCV7249289.1 acetolactate synthase large subunit [Mycolicibacillus koreensis]ODR10206.1 decarboxylase [Mycolicibacillus koreensis]OSC35562.1 acetolactate synthase large subunit [Mycolicibacillus koreensis]BBY53201.1 acetolactate synthase I/II/III large subunit [Mycolicibacillus koreensis]
MANGAQALITTLVDCGVQVCFANPGTSEMHFVAALDAVPQMRGVLCLFEGVATGAADGYARIAGAPAATLLHLGPGLSNGLANLHNARRAHSPVVNIIGDHATYHKKYDAPLESEIEPLTAWTHGWTRRTTGGEEVGRDVAEAVAAAASAPGQIANVILPADISWSDGATAGVPVRAGRPSDPDPTALAEVAAVLTGGDPVCLLLGGPATGAAGLAAADRIAVATGARTLVETFPARLTRGAGVPPIERLGYLAEQAGSQLDGIKHLVVAGTRAPVTFFAYPDKPSDLVPDGAAVHTLAGRDTDVVAALQQLAEIVAPGTAARGASAAVPELPTGALTVENWVQVIGALLPPQAIISDESNTSGLLLAAATAGSPQHDVLALTGGAIGQGLPVAVGAAIAAPDRPVVALQADGSAAYTISALWTMAREQLDITVVLLNNSAYAILRMELARVGADGGGPKAADLLDLRRPEMDFAEIAAGFGVPATVAVSCEDLADQFAAALTAPGPHLIDARIPTVL